MTFDEALKELETFPINCLDFKEKLALSIVLEILEEFKTLKEKSEPKKPIERTDNDGYVEYYCPNCEAHLFFDEEQKFCNECGQAIVCR